MKKSFLFILTLAFGMGICLPKVSAQISPVTSGSDKAKPAETAKPAAETVKPAASTAKPMSASETKAKAEALPCDDCTVGQPTQLYSGTKNAVTISGPPDGKGEPVEYHIFTQSRIGGNWKFETGGRVTTPGQKITFKYFRPAQVMVVVFCETPFADMATFSNIRVAEPIRTEPCTDCPCERCERPVPTAVFSSTDNNITVTRLSEAQKAVQYQVFTQAKDKTWKAEKANVIKTKGEKVSACYGKPAQTLVLVYGETPKDVAVKFAPANCNK